MCIDITIWSSWECGNVQNRWRCDILLRYRCTDSKKICVRFFTALIFGYAKGIAVATAILNSLGNVRFQLSLNHLTNQRSDGLNMNQIIWNHINTHDWWGSPSASSIYSLQFACSPHCISQMTYLLWTWCSANSAWYLLLLEATALQQRKLFWYVARTG